MPYFHFRCVARATFDRNLIHSADTCFLVMACVGYSRAQLKTLSSLLKLPIASVSHISVLKDSSLSCAPFLIRREERPASTVLICLSQTPPMWLAAGTFILNLIQSQCDFKSWSLMQYSSISSRASLNSRQAPTKLVPTKLPGPLWLRKRLNAFMKESVSKDVAVSRCIAREDMQVKRIP